MTSSCPQTCFDFYDEENLQLIQSIAKGLCASGRLRPHDTEDIVQEIIIAIAELWPTFDPTTMAVEEFINTVARRRCRRLRHEFRSDAISAVEVTLDALCEDHAALVAEPCANQTSDPMDAVHERLEGLPPYLQSFAILLITNSWDEILILEGICIRTYYQRISRLRRVLVTEDSTLARRYPKAQKTLDRLNMARPKPAENYKFMDVTDATPFPLGQPQPGSRPNPTGEQPGPPEPTERVDLAVLGLGQRTKPGPGQTRRTQEKPSPHNGHQAGADPKPHPIQPRRLESQREPDQTNTSRQGPQRLFSGHTEPTPPGKGKTAGTAQDGSELDRFGNAPLAASYEARVNPGVTVLVPLLTGVDAMITDAESSGSEIAEVQMALNQHQAVVPALLHELAGQLRMIYRKLPGGIQRNMVRFFGFNFRKQPNSTTEAGADEDGTSNMPKNQSDPTANQVCCQLHQPTQTLREA